jgi:Lysine-specific metallo-endopeptidase
MPVTFTGFPPGDLSKYRTAFNNAKSYVSKARIQVRGMWENRTKADPAHQAARDKFTTFWGPLTEDRATALAENYRLLMAALLGDLTIEYDGTDLTSKAYVFVADCATDPGDPYTAKMHFCPPLLDSYAAIGTNSAMGTIIHELSHLVLGTADHVYGMKSCTELLTPEKITNADNYKYYSELFQYRPGTEPELTNNVDIHSPPKRGSG